MNTMRNSKLLLALFALLLVFGACKGESPTAPPTGGGGGGGGGGTTNTFDMALTASNANPVVDSTSIITATVTLNGSPAPNGTAVQFTANGGALDGEGTSIIKTTTGGTASVSLTATVPGAITVGAVVANVSRSVTVTFRASTVPPVPPVTTPTIESITPSIGRPQGGETIRIVGRNFKAPVRVLFDTGAALPVEAFVVSVTDTVIEVLTPAVNLGSGQELPVDVIVITQAGTATEARVERATGFTFRNDQLTPVINTASPNSGPVTGGTRVTIFGEGFQAPVQVLFGTAEARVVNVDFSQIIVEAPTARDTSPDGSGVVVGPVDITVRNINSGTEDSMAGGFAYKAAMAITAVGPGGGPYTGGTRVEIDGIGFVGPVSVVVRTSEGDVALQPINVSGTRIIAITPRVAIENCEPLEGPLIVTNIINGDQAEGPPFIFVVPQPIIVRIQPANALDPVINEGDLIRVTVVNSQPGDVVRFRIGDAVVFPTGETFDPASGTVTYTVAVPVNVEFDTEPCSVNGSEGDIEVGTSFDIAYENATTGCEDVAEDSLFVTPSAPTCNADPVPNAEIAFTANGAGCLSAGSAAVGSPTGGGTVTFNNTGTAALTVTAGTPAGTNAAEFQVTPPSRTIAPGASANFSVVATPGATGTRNATVTFTTNDPDNAAIALCLQATGTP
jgi:hypothetical protein